MEKFMIVVQGIQTSKVILDFLFVCIHSAPWDLSRFVNVVTEEKIGNSLHILCILLPDKTQLPFK